MALRCDHQDAIRGTSGSRKYIAESIKKGGVSVRNQRRRCQGVSTTVARGNFRKLFSCRYSGFFSVCERVSFIIVVFLSVFASRLTCGSTAGDPWRWHNLGTVSWVCGGCQCGISSNLPQDNYHTLFVLGVYCEFCCVKLSASRTQRQLLSIPLLLAGGIFC